MKYFTTLVIGVAVLSGGILAQTPASAGAMLKAAMQHEKVDGDLAAAIRTYQAIAETFPKDPAAPEALLRLAKIYEGLKRPDALATYQLIVAKYPGSEPFATQALRRVEALSLAAAKFRQTEVPIPPQAVDLGGRISPDGRLMSFVDDTFVANGQGSLGVWDLQSGTTRLVALSKNWAEETVRESVWSPDGTRLAYSWWNGRERLYELRVVPLAGSAPRIVFKDVRGAIPMQLFAWSPDGRMLAAAIAREENSAEAQAANVRQQYRIVLISVADGTVRTLRNLDNVRVPRHGKFSPDGRHFAYDWPSSVDSASRDIFVVATDGSSHATFVANPASNDELLTWLAEGSYILYAADRGGTREALAQAFTPARARLEPIVVRREIGDVSSLGLTRDGRLFVTRAVGATHVALVPLDPATGLASGPPAELTPALSGVSRDQPAWSLDGRFLAYFQRTTGTDWTLTAHDLASGAIRTFPAALREPERPVWQPDGKAIVFHAFDAKNIGGQYRTDLSTGRTERFSDGHSGGFSPDGQYFFHPAPGVVMKRRLADGIEQVVDRGRHRSMVLSPDGTMLALFDPGTATEGPSIAIAPATGGPRRTVVSAFPDAMDNEIAWSHDSQFLYFKAGEIWRVPAAGGKPERAGIKEVGKHMSVSPDGKRMAVSEGAWLPEVWIWEHLLLQTGRR